MVKHVTDMLLWPRFHLWVQAKSAASMQDKWLLVNIQSTREFSSHMVFYSCCSIFQFSWLFVSALSLLPTIFFFVKLNRDTWANDAVSQIISTNFIFWQVSLLIYSPEYWWSIYFYFYFCSVLLNRRYLMSYPNHLRVETN
jgi:hypothetical protein